MGLGLGFWEGHPKILGRALDIRDIIDHVEREHAGLAFGAQELHAQSACLSRCFLVIGVRENMLELGSVYNWRVRTVACARGGDKVARKRDEQKRVVCVRESKCFHC